MVQAPAARHFDLCNQILDATSVIDELDTPDSVLDCIHHITSREYHINVLAAARLPEQFGNLDEIVDRETIFLHSSAPEGWWKAYIEASQDYPSVIYAMTELCMSPFTATEAMRRLDPVGADRWSVEMSHNLGMRDYLVCPVG